LVELMGLFLFVELPRITLEKKSALL